MFKHSLPFHLSAHSVQDFTKSQKKNLFVSDGTIVALTRAFSVLIKMVKCLYCRARTKDNPSGYRSFIRISFVGQPLCDLGLQGRILRNFKLDKIFATEPVEF